MNRNKKFIVGIIVSGVIILTLNGCLSSDKRIDFIPIEEGGYVVDTISGVNPETFYDFYYEVKKSHLFNQGVEETHRDTVQNGKVIRTFGMMNGKLYQLLELTDLGDIE